MASTAHLRFATPADAAALLTIYAPIVLESPASFQVEPPSVEEMAAKVEETMVHYPWLVYEADGAVLGYAYGTKHRARVAYQWSVETSVYIHSDARRQGIGTVLYEALLRILAAQGYYRAFAGIVVPNTGSVRLHESVGFKPLGVFKNIGYKLNQWRDVGWWSRDLAPLPETPEPPLLLAAVRTQWEDGWEWESG